MVAVGCLSVLSACSDDGGNEGNGGSGGTGGGNPTAGGGTTSMAGKAAGGSMAGTTTGGIGVGGSSGGGSTGSLDQARVKTAHKIARRFSLGDRDHNVCIARADGGVLCTIAAVGTVLMDKKVDLVTMSGLGYCAILDDKSVKCENATSDSDASKAFAAGVTTADNLLKNGDGLIVVKAGGAIDAWTGEKVVTATAATGAFLGGVDLSVCPLAPDGSVSCFNYFDGDAFDRSQFGFANTKYADVAQSLMLLAGIDMQGKLRVRYSLEDADKEYPTDVYVQVAAYSDYWCMLTNSGTLKCDGYDINKGPAGIADVPSGEFLAVDVNEDFACAVRTTGELVCWGGTAPTVTDKVRIE